MDWKSHSMRINEIDNNIKFIVDLDGLHIYKFQINDLASRNYIYSNIKFRKGQVFDFLKKRSECIWKLNTSEKIWYKISSKEVK